MSLNVGRTKLLTALKELRTRWDQVRQDWNDKVAQDFQTRYIDPLDGSTRAAVTAMEEMYELVHRARKECENRDVW